MTWFSTLASCGIAIGSPLVYLDQYLSIKRTKSSEDRTANITRLYYWLGERFDTALLVQSILMIIAQLGLLRICLKHNGSEKVTKGEIEEVIQFETNNNLETFNTGTRCMNDSNSPTVSSIALLHDTTSSSSAGHDHFDLQIHPPPLPSSFLIRPKGFDFYIDFFALLFAFQAALFILLQRYDWFIQAIGFFSLGLESTLPIPQLITNYRRKSLAGLSSMVLIGWLFGDSFKSIYLVLLTPESNSIQFKICALFQLSIDVLILGQALIYRRQTKLDTIALNRSSRSRSSTISDNLINNPPAQNRGGLDPLVHPSSKLMIVDQHVV